MERKLGQCSGAPCVWGGYLSRLVKEDTPHQIPYIFGYLLTMFLFLFFKVCGLLWPHQIPNIFLDTNLTRFIHCLVMLFFQNWSPQNSFYILVNRTEAPQTSRLNPLHKIDVYSMQNVTKGNLGLGLVKLEQGFTLRLMFSHLELNHFHFLPTRMIQFVSIITIYTVK